MLLFPISNTRDPNNKMAKSFDGSLSKIWGDDVQESPKNQLVSTTSPTVIKMTPPPNSSIRSELKQFYKDHDLENLAKKTRVLDQNGEIYANIKIATAPSSKGQSYVTTTAPTKMAIKLEQGTIPKTTLLSVPIQVISASQRNFSPQVIASPRNQQQQSFNQSPVDWSMKRMNNDEDRPPEQKPKKRKTEKGEKGLRHFSMKVCEKVKQKGTTSYNEVADELVSEFTDPSKLYGEFDQKNIRRRVYDALNVLMAMNIISKEKKEIKWLGLPTNSAQECHNLEEQKQLSLKRIEDKMITLKDLLVQQVTFKNLVERNKKFQAEGILPLDSNIIKLPFVCVSAKQGTDINCNISEDKSEFYFKFGQPFEIHDDIEVLRRLNLAKGFDDGTCTDAELEKIKKMVAKSLEPYVTHFGKGKGLLPPGMPTSLSQPGTSSNFNNNSNNHHLAILDGDLTPGGTSSRQGAFTPSEDYSDTESEPSSPGEN